MTTEKFDSNIVLIGMRGCGKTTVAGIISRETKRECLELDEILVERSGMKIPEIVSRYGWDYFRNFESEIALTVAIMQDKIISTGGGVVLRPKNMEALKDSGIVVYLRCSVDVLLQRVGEDPNRPALTDKGTRKEEMEEILRQRRVLYEKYADIIIDADEPDAEKQAFQILTEILGD